MHSYGGATGTGTLEAEDLFMLQSALHKHLKDGINEIKNWQPFVLTCAYGSAMEFRAQTVSPNAFIQRGLLLYRLKDYKSSLKTIQLGVLGLYSIQRVRGNGYEFLTTEHIAVWLCCFKARVCQILSNTLNSNIHIISSLSMLGVETLEAILSVHKIDKDNDKQTFEVIKKIADVECRVLLLVLFYECVCVCVCLPHTHIQNAVCECESAMSSDPHTHTHTNTHTNTRTDTLTPTQRTHILQALHPRLKKTLQDSDAIENIRDTAAEEIKTSIRSLTIVNPVRLDITIRLCDYLSRSPKTHKIAVNILKETESLLRAEIIDAFERRCVESNFGYQPVLTSEDAAAYLFYGLIKERIKMLSAHIYVLRIECKESYLARVSALFGATHEKATHQHVHVSTQARPHTQAQHTTLASAVTSFIFPKLCSKIDFMNLLESLDFDSDDDTHTHTFDTGAHTHTYKDRQKRGS